MGTWPEALKAQSDAFSSQSPSCCSEGEQGWGSQNRTHRMGSRLTQDERPSGQQEGLTGPGPEFTSEQRNPQM